MEVVEKVKSKPGVLDTVRNLLDSASPILIDAACIKLLVSKVGSVNFVGFTVRFFFLLPGV